MPALTLHDYIARTKNWEQLWSDDRKAFWFEPYKYDKRNSYLTPDYNYLVHEYEMLDTQINNIRCHYCKGLDQAMELWNNLINEYLKAKHNSLQARKDQLMPVHIKVTYIPNITPIKITIK
jgi:hypothetical protein